MLLKRLHWHPSTCRVFRLAAGLFAHSAYRERALHGTSFLLSFRNWCWYTLVFFNPPPNCASHELVHEFHHHTLVLVKALILQRKVSLLVAHLNSPSNSVTLDIILQTSSQTAMYISILANITYTRYISLELSTYWLTDCLRPSSSILWCHVEEQEASLGWQEEWFQESDLLFSKGSNVLGLSRMVSHSATGLEEGIGSCAGIHLTSLNISKLHLTLAQCRTVCTVFFKKMCVFQV